MSYHWTEDLSVGITEIDDQHKELFRQVDNLIHAMNTGKGRDEVINIIGFLETHITDHFGLEEKQMLVLNYPLFPAHKAHHTTFITEFWAMKKNFEENGATCAFTAHLNVMLNDWIKNHVCVVDKELGKFIKAA